MWRIILFWVSVLCVVSAGADGLVLKSWQMTTAHGLPNNTVRSVFQDHSGRIWMGTQNGLASYDGNRVVVHALNDAVGRERIPAPRIRQIAEDGRHRIWLVLGDGRAACFDPVGGCLSDVRGDGSCVLEANHIWIAASGEAWLWHSSRPALWHMPVGGRLSRLALQEGESVRQMAEDKDGNLYVGTTRRLLFRPAGRSVFACIGRGHDYLQAVDAGPEGGVCWASRDGKLWRTDGKGGRAELMASLPAGSRVTGAAWWRGSIVVFTQADTWTCRPSDGTLERCVELQVPGGAVFHDNRGGAWVCNGTGVLHGLPESSARPWVLRLLDARQLSSVDRERYTVCRLRGGQTCISAYGAGLFVHDASSGELCRHSASDRLPLTGSDFLYEMIEDRSGDIWVGQRNAGLAHLFVVPGGVRRVNGVWADGRPDEAEIKAVACAPDGTVWVADRAGRLGLLDDSLRKVVVWKVMLPSPAYALGFEADGNLLAGTRKHGVWSMKTKQAEGAGGVFAFCTDRKGRVWAGYFGNGLRVCTGEGWSDPFGGAGPARRIRRMAVDSAGCIWAATEAGLLAFDPDSLCVDPSAYRLYTAQNSGLCGSELNTVFADSSGRIWVGTLGHGAYRCRRLPDGRLETECYDTGRGLAANEVQSILEDRGGRIWVATQYGLSCMERGAGFFSSFYLSSTLQGDMYGANAAALAPDGSLLLGTSDGLAVVDPEKMDVERVSPLPHFTEFYAGGQPLALEEDDRGEVKKVELGWDRNSVTVRFSNLDYSRFRSSRYSYRLEGYDTCWSVPSESGEAVFRDLPAGDYTLLVRSSNSSGVWCSGAAALAFSVAPPFYRTPWAYSVYAGLFVLLAGVSWSVTARMMRLRRMVEMEREMSGFKLRFFLRVIQGVCEPLERLQERLSAERPKGKAGAELGRLRQVLQQSLTFKDSLPDEAQAALLMEPEGPEQGREEERLAETEKDGFGERLEAVVAAHLRDAGFTADAWAGEMGMRRTAFYRQIKEQTGMTPNEFLRTARLKRAAELLLEGRLNVSEVAYEVGFEDLSYFSKSFKSYFGMSPSVFQKGKRAVRPGGTSPRPTSSPRPSSPD